MIIAVIGCKAKKQNYPCKAEEMYSKSFVYRAQLDFVKQAYNRFYILSSKYGLLHPDTIIEPYDTTLYSKTDIKYSPKIENEINYWNMVNNQLNDISHNNIHFHTSNQYIKGIKHNVRHIKQQRAFGSIKNVYVEALQMYNGSNLEECLTHLQTIKPSKYNEQAKWFYHPTMGEFYGKASQLKRQFPDYINEGSAYQLSVGKVNQHKGWTLKRNVL